jgi:hypothetical protein
MAQIGVDAAAAQQQLGLGPWRGVAPCLQEDSMPPPLNLSEISDQLVAVAALGTAAFGLVDASKAFWGGISNFGFGHVRKALEPFDPALTAAIGAEQRDGDWRSLFRSHWINGRPKEQQKAIATALIQLGLTPETAPALARAGLVDGEKLRAVIEALTYGRELDAEQVNLLGRFKSAVEARMDAAYERADQSYRNAARVAAGFVSVGLAIVAALWFYPGTSLISAALVGVIAVPLAPIAKDVTSGLAAAARAVAARLSP